MAGQDGPKEDKVVDASTEHLRTVGFTLVTASLVILLVQFQTPDPASFAATQADTETLRKIVQKHGRLQSRADVKTAFATMAAQELRAGRSPSPDDRAWFGVEGFGVAECSLLEFLIYEPYSDGQPGYSIGRLSGAGSGTWGGPANEAVVPDATLAAAADGWDRMDLSFEVVVPAEAPKAAEWLERGKTRPAKAERVDRQPGGSDPRPLSFGRWSGARPAADGAQARWGYGRFDTTMDAILFFPVEVSVVTVRPQLAAMKEAGAPARWTTGSFRTAFPELFRRMGSDADKPFAQILSLLDRERHDQQQAASVEILGLKLQPALLDTFGLGVVAILQLYFLIHLRALLRLAPARIRTSPVPWMPLYEDAASRAMSLIFLILLPLFPGVRAARHGSFASTALGLVCIGLAAALALGFAKLWRAKPTGP